MLTKRTYIVPALIACIAFPAAAIAASDGEGDVPKAAVTAMTPQIGVADAAPAKSSPLEWSVERFHRVVRAAVQRMRVEHRVELRRKRRELFASLPTGVSQATLDAIGACESGGDPTAVSSEGTYRGKYQFDYGTWESVGGTGDPVAASESEQDYRAALLYARSGSSPWPICG